jgi:hypothetical protein
MVLEWPSEYSVFTYKKKWFGLQHFNNNEGLAKDFESWLSSAADFFDTRTIVFPDETNASIPAESYMGAVVEISTVSVIISQQTNSVALSPQANYTDWVTATCRRNLVPAFVDRGVSRGKRCASPTVFSLFSRPEPLLFFQVAPHLSSQGLSGPRSIPTASQKIWQRLESNPGPLG